MLHDDLMKALAKKKGEGQKDMDPKAKEAKMGVLKHISKMAGDAMANDLHGFKKVSVAAPDNQSLKEGLKMAQDYVGGEGNTPTGHGLHEGADEADKVVGKEGAPLHSDQFDEDEEDDGEGNPLSEHDDGEDEDKPQAEHMLEEQIDHEAAEGDLSEEDIDTLIADLTAKKQALLAKK